MEIIEILGWVETDAVDGGVGKTQWRKLILLTLLIDERSESRP